MNYLKIVILLFPFFLIVLPNSFSQENHQTIRFGFNYGIGTQQIFPFNDTDYYYKVQGYKILINYPLKTGVFNFELQIEPSIYSAHHNLVNESFVQPDYGPDYLLERDIYTKRKTISEYVLNVGIVIRYNLNERISCFILSSTGPMISDTETERLAKGFAFSNIVALGMATRFKKVEFEIRPGLRHVSNADTQFPNCGHNSTTLDFGISLIL